MDLFYLMVIFSFEQCGPFNAGFSVTSFLSLRDRYCANRRNQFVYLLQMTFFTINTYEMLAVKHAGPGADCLVLNAFSITCLHCNSGQVI